VAWQKNALHNRIDLANLETSSVYLRHLTGVCCSQNK